MLMMKERRPGFRTIEGWARSVLLEAGAIRECEEHGWMRDRADRMPASARSLPPAAIRRRASHGTMPSPQSKTFSVRSATAVRIARARPVRRRLNQRAVAVR